MTLFFGTDGESKSAVFFSHRLDPFDNLSFEEWLLREGMNELDLDLGIYLYRNSASVISGRFQVPWKEMNFLSPKRSELKYVRRRSGGGTVYHDEGNWNFSFFHRGRELYRQENLTAVIKAVQKLGLTLETNERHDLVFRVSEKVYKVSGSAFKQTKEMSYHHGTLLVEAKLDWLKGILGMTHGWQVTGKGIASVPSPVTNLREHGLKGDFTDFIKAIAEGVGIRWSTFEPLDCDLTEWSRSLRDPKWRWEETPENFIEFGEGTSRLRLHLLKGRVVAASRCEKALMGLRVQDLEKEQMERLLAGLEADKAIHHHLRALFFKFSF